MFLEKYKKTGALLSLFFKEFLSTDTIDEP